MSLVALGDSRQGSKESQGSESRQSSKELVQDAQEFLSALALKKMCKMRKRCEGFIYALPFFKLCKEEFVEEVAVHLHRESILQGTVIVHRHDVIGALHIVIVGNLEIIIEDNGLSMFVGDIREHSFFGEQILCHDADRSATANIVAKSMCVTYRLEEDEFVEVLDRFPGERQHFKLAEVIQPKSPKSPKSPGLEKGNNAEQRQRSLSTILKQVSVFTIPMFMDCDQAFLSYVNMRMHRQILFTGQVLMKEGDSGDSCILLTCGSVITEVSGRKVAEMGEGSVFGELAVLGISEQRPSTVRASSLCHIQVLARSVLRSALDQYPEEFKRFLKLVDTRSTQNVTAPPLRKVKFFSSCSEEFLQLLQGSLDEKLYMSNQTVVEEGTEGEAIYIILQGTCEAVVQGQVVGILQDGAVFGEMTALGLVDKTTASVIAKCSCFVQILHRAVILHALDQCPEERNMFMKLSGERFQRMSQRLSRSKNTLQSYAFFKDCSEGFLNKLRENLQEKMFLPGSDIVVEGAEGSTCFVLHQGTAEVTKKEVLLKKFESGSVFGEFVVLGLTGVRECTVKATSICLVEELQRDSLWAAIEEYPQEAKIFERLVNSHLETTMNDALTKCSFFRGLDNRVVTSIALTAQTRVTAPMQWIVRENMYGDSMFVINRGTVSVHVNSQDVGIMRAGDYVGATTMLGSHKTYPAGYRAKMMCHVINITRADFMKAMQQVEGKSKDWLKSLQDHEKDAFEQEMTELVKQAKTARMIERIKRNIQAARSQENGLSSFTFLELLRGGSLENPREILQKYLTAWFAHVHAAKLDTRTSRRSSSLSAYLATKRFSTNKILQQQKKLEEEEIEDMNNNSRSGSKDGAMSVAPSNFSYDGDDMMPDPENGTAIVPAIAPQATVEDIWTKDVSRMVRGIMQATDGVGLYNSNPANTCRKQAWNTDWKLFKGPGIPEPQAVPWSASVAGCRKSRTKSQTARSWNPRKILMTGGAPRRPQ